MFARELPAIPSTQYLQPLVLISTFFGARSELDVTDEESDTAVEIFGCDCIASINCLRRLRDQLP